MKNGLNSLISQRGCMNIFIKYITFIIKYIISIYNKLNYMCIINIMHNINVINLL